jgi:hypothetical protein
MKYIAVSTVHFLALFLHYDLRTTDPEAFGIFPILATAVIMLIPVLTWPTTFRTCRAKAVIQYWAILVYAVVLPAIIPIAYLNLIPMSIRQMASPRFPTTSRFSETCTLFATVRMT